MSKNLFFTLPATHYNHVKTRKNRLTVPDLVQSMRRWAVRSPVQRQQFARLSFCFPALLLLHLDASHKCLALSPPLLLHKQHTVPPATLPSSCVIQWTTQPLNNYWPVRHLTSSGTPKASQGNAKYLNATV